MQMRVPVAVGKIQISRHNFDKRTAFDVLDSPAEWMKRMKTSETACRGGSDTYHHTYKTPTATSSSMRGERKEGQKRGRT